MSSPGILSLIGFNSGQDWDVEDYWCDFSVTPVPIFLGLGLRGLNLGLGLDNKILESNPAIQHVRYRSHWKDLSDVYLVLEMRPKTWIEWTSSVVVVKNIHPRISQFSFFSNCWFIPHNSIILLIWLWNDCRGTLAWLRDKHKLPTELLAT